MHLCMPALPHHASVQVLNDAVSEGGHLTQDGVPVVTHRALYVVLADVPGVDVHDEAAVKDKLCADIAAAVGGPAPTLHYSAA